MLPTEKLVDLTVTNPTGNVSIDSKKESEKPSAFAQSNEKQLCYSFQ